MIYILNLPAIHCISFYYVQSKLKFLPEIMKALRKKKYGKTKILANTKEARKIDHVAKIILFCKKNTKV